MKRLFIFFLALATVFCLVGCSACGSADGGAGTDLQSGIEQDGSGNSGEIAMVTITCGENILEMELADTLSARAFAQRLAEGDVTVSVRGYGGFEMVGGLGFSLERDDRQMTTQTGDVVLYNGNQIVIFYDSNSWSYTKIGHISGATRLTLENFFGTTGEVNITFSADRED